MVEIIGMSGVDREDSCSLSATLWTLGGANEPGQPALLQSVRSRWLLDFAA